MGLLKKLHHYTILLSINRVLFSYQYQKWVSDITLQKKQYCLTPCSMQTLDLNWFCVQIFPDTWPPLLWPTTCVHIILTMSEPSMKDTTMSTTPLETNTEIMQRLSSTLNLQLKYLSIFSEFQQACSRLRTTYLTMKNKQKTIYFYVRSIFC